MIKKLLNLLFAVLLLLSTTMASANDNTAQTDTQSTYIFGVFPYLSPARLDKIYAPVSQQLSDELGHAIRFQTSSTFNIFLGKLKAGYYDFALIQPFWYPLAVDGHDYQSALNMREPFVSLVMVLADSEFHSVEDLRGKTIATPPAFVPVVHMARESLIKLGLEPGKDVFFEDYKTVDSCMQQVLIRNADACIAPPFAPGPFEKAMNVDFRPVHESYSIPNLALVVHKRVPGQLRQALVEAIQGWQATSRGQQLLSEMQTSGFEITRDSDYDVVRTMLKNIRSQTR